MSRILILAAGPNLGWNGIVPRHLVNVPWYPAAGDVMPLIHRTQMLVAGPHRMTGTEHEVFVVTQGHNFADFGVPELYPKVTLAAPSLPTRGWEQEWDGSRDLWSLTERTIILLGDTYYDDQLIHRILTDDTEHWHFYARFEPNDRKPFGEGFAWVIHPSAHEHLDTARAAVKQQVETGAHSRASGWEVYRQAVGLPIWLHAREYSHGIEPPAELLKWTEDFDTHDEYVTWLMSMEEPAP